MDVKPRCRKSDDRSKREPGRWLHATNRKLASFITLIQLAPRIGGLLVDDSAAADEHAGKRKDGRNETQDHPKNFGKPAEAAKMQV